MIESFYHFDRKRTELVLLVKAPALGKLELAALEKIWHVQNEITPFVSETHRWTGTLRRQALGRVVRASNSIEGFEANLPQVQDILLSGSATDLDNETNQAISGYRDAMTFLLQLTQDGPIRFNLNLIKSLHFMLTKGDLGNRPGRFRSGPVYVLDEQSGQIVHEGADFDELPDLMTEFCNSIEESTGEVDLVSAAMAHLNLVLVHPFKDGNGRMARIIQSAILAGSSPLSPVFLSIEEYLASHTPEYYSILATTGKGTWNPKTDAKQWLRFNLEAHWHQAHQVRSNAKYLNTIWAEVAQLAEKLGLSERHNSALAHVTSGNRLTSPTYRLLLAESDEVVSVQTATRDLVALTQLGLLIAQGETKSRQYAAGPELQKIASKVNSKLAKLKATSLFN